MRIDSLKILRRSSQTPPPDNRGGLLRLIALGTAFALAIASLGVRLFDLQTRFQADSAQQVTRASVRTRELPALRGLIYDRNGEAVVRNAPLYQIAIVPAELPDRDDTIQRRIDRVAIYNRLAEIIAQPGLTAGDIFTKVLQQSGVAPYRPIVVAENIPRETALYIQELALTMPGYMPKALARAITHTGTCWATSWATSAKCRLVPKRTTSATATMPASTGSACQGWNS